MKLNYLLLLCSTLIINGCGGGETSSQTTTTAGSVVINDNLDNYDTGFWLKSNGWANGTPFLNGWCDSQITHQIGIMKLTLQKQDCAGKTHASGEYRSNSFYSDIRIEARIKAVALPGTITSLFTYTGPVDGNPHDEIDIEIFGKDPTKMQANYWKNGIEYPAVINLGFDASADFHTYAFEWRSNSIKWYVDGVLVHTATTDIPTTPGRIMMNLWACDNSNSGIIDWCGTYDATLTGPYSAEYDWVRLTQY